ncbi:MAG TPA: hypothetical protein VF865_03780, partial [Acidobacteriaceae bacterium]
MFEGSLVESRGLVASGTQRWTALGSLTLQCAVAGLLIAFPMIRPESLSVTPGVPQLTIPLPVKPPVPVVREAATATSSAMNVPATAVQQTEATQRFVFHRLGVGNDGPAPTFDTSLPFGPGGGGPA